MSISVPNYCAFDPEATAVMGKVFDAACEELHLPKHKWMRELIAARIIAAARSGELDPVRLRSAALTAMSHIVVSSGGYSWQ